MAVERTYYTIDPEGKLTCMKCKVPLVKGKAKFMYLENGFPVEMPVCPKCGLSMFGRTGSLGKVLAGGTCTGGQINEQTSRVVRHRHSIFWNMS